jgi:hypothetical protein
LIPAPNERFTNGCSRLLVGGKNKISHYGLSCTMTSAAMRSAGLAWISDLNAGVLISVSLIHCERIRNRIYSVQNQEERTIRPTPDRHAFKSTLFSRWLCRFTYLGAKSIPVERVNGTLYCRTSTGVLVKRTRKIVMQAIRYPC